MKSLFYLLFALTFLIFFTVQAAAQPCFHPSDYIIPVSLYEENNENPYVYFSGDSTIMRGPHSEELSFLSPYNDYKVDISFRVSMAAGAGTIMGQNFNGYGWLIAFDVNDSNKLKFLMYQNPYSIISFEIPASKPPYDTNWTTFRIVYNKAASTFTTYQDNVLAHQFNNVSWQYAEDAGAAFALGASNVLVHYGYNDYSARDFFKGSIDDLLIKINDTNYININFNWGGGQFALDSASFFIFDRVWADNPVNNMRGLTFGNTTGPDRYDPAWIKPPFQDTSYTTLGSGFFSWNEEWPVQSREAWQANSVTYNNNLYVTGNHNRVNGTAFVEGDTSYGVSSWDESTGTWKNVSGGLDGYGLHINTWHNNSNNEFLVVTGVFSKLHTSGTTVNNIALWDGNNWSALTDPGTNKQGITNSVYTATGFVTTTFQGSLVVGGAFTNAGSVAACNIAKWSYNSEAGTYRWENFSGGLGTPPGEAVYALAVYNNTLYAGGDFGFINNGAYAQGLAKWNISTGKWVLADNPEPNTHRIIQVLYVYDNKLWVGGSFKKVNGVTCNGIAYFDGSGWHNIGNGSQETGLGGSSAMNYDGEITDMVSDGYNLFICGSFEKVNGELCNKIAVYNRQNWCTLGYGLDLRPEGLSIYNGKLVITGDMYSAEGKNLNNIALYDITRLMPIGINNNSIIAGKFSLSQNYPNPFNPLTKIKFSIPAAGSGNAMKTTLKIFDILGREVTTLINSRLDAGEHEVTWDASENSSGIYFYSLSAGEYSETRKMVLIK